MIVSVFHFTVEEFWSTLLYSIDTINLSFTKSDLCCSLISKVEVWTLIGPLQYLDLSLRNHPTVDFLVILGSLNCYMIHFSAKLQLLDTSSHI